jgi:hypothetical protein
LTEAATNAEKKQPFGGKRYSRLKDPKNISLGIEGSIMAILERLAYGDTRNIRDYIRKVLKDHAKTHILAGTVKGRITDSGEVELEDS